MKIPNTLKYRVQQDRTKDLNLYVDIKGEGKPLILLHGFGMSRHSFRHLIGPLSKKYKVYNFDLKGFGDSPKPDDGRYSPYDQAVLIQNYIDKHNLKNVTLLGHSYGGGVVLILSYLNQQNINKMVLISPAAYRQNLPSLIAWMQKPIIGYIGYYLLPYSYKVRESYKFSYYDDSKIDEKDISNAIINMKKQNAESVFYDASFDLIPSDIDKITKNYSSIKIPTLIIWGYNDVIVRKKNGIRLKKELKNADLKFIQNCGHIPQLEKPDEVIDLILDYL
jgi:pimeloyl-ACP methyl ester carboxylesterase